MDFVVGDLDRQGFGFANPNHAAAAICALFPFCWGWGGARGAPALPVRGDEQFINEPHIGNAPQNLCFGGDPRAKRRARRARKGPRGNPVASSKGMSCFNDMLGTTGGTTSNGKYFAAALTAFGESFEDIDIKCKFIE